MSESGTSGSVPTPSTAFSSFLPVYITTSRHDTQPTQQTPHTTTIYTQSTYSAVPSDPTTKLPVGAIAGGVSAGVVLALLVTAGWIYWGRAIDKSVAKHRKEDVSRYFPCFLLGFIPILFVAEVLLVGLRPSFNAIAFKKIEEWAFRDHRVSPKGLVHSSFYCTYVLSHRTLVDSYILCFDNRRNESEHYQTPVKMPL